jgi:hypothetical protein
MHALPLPLTVKDFLCDVALAGDTGSGDNWHFINPFGVAGFEEFNGGGVVGGGLDSYGDI